uniref:ESCRT-II complex subunit VPS25 n=1 Tax=Arcella intermedia TaxID=1963864 RepID=A0A6B2LM09_9EUKA
MNTRKKQVDMWIDFILDYTKFHKLSQIQLNQHLNSPLFCNSKINRKLSYESAHYILEELVKKGNAEWMDKEKTGVYVYWYKIDHWASLIYKYITDNNMIDVVCTPYELTESDEVSDQEFYQLDNNVFMKAIKHLEEKNLSKIITGNSGEIGIKFKSM